MQKGDCFMNCIAKRVSVWLLAGLLAAGNTAAFAAGLPQDTGLSTKAAAEQRQADELPSLSIPEEVLQKQKSDWDGLMSAERSKTVCGWNMIGRPANR